MSSFTPRGPAQTSAQARLAKTQKLDPNSPCQGRGREHISSEMTSWGACAAVNSHRSVLGVEDTDSD